MTRAILGAALAASLCGGAAQAVTVELVAKLTAADGAADDRFGRSVALDGGTALVGARLDDDAGTNSGSAYLFDAGTGTQTAKLTASDAAAGDNFGFSVALDGGTALVGAIGDDDGGNTSGSAYLFDAGTGAQTAKLTASDAAGFDMFGYSVALDGGTALVGAYGDDDAGSASGSAYLFDAGTGAQTAKLTASDAAGGDRFGLSVALDGGTALVGAYGDDDAGSASGSAYLFDAGTGAQTAKLTASDAAGFDMFGYSVALDGGTALVGAYGDDDAGSASGSAYLFDAGTGAQTAKLTASDAAGGDRFGLSVALDGGTALVGAYGDDDAGSASGSVYLFDTLSGLQVAQLLADDGAAGDQFGWSVAVSGDLVLVGAPFADVGGNANQGAAYLFRVTDAAVPLPAPAWLLLAGLGALALRARR